MTINKFLTDEIKNISGNLLLIGEYNDRILSKIQINNKILKCNVMSNEKKSNNSGKRKRQKNINIKKIKKYFKYNNYIIGDLKELEKYLKTFVKDSVYINKDKIYLICDENYDYDYLLKMYYRYNVAINVEKFDDGIILVIDTRHSKNHPFKNIFFRIKDTAFNIIDIIGDYLVN